jgi:hypothetical protein
MVKPFGIAALASVDHGRNMRFETVLFFLKPIAEGLGKP